MASEAEKSVWAVLTFTVNSPVDEYDVPWTAMVPPPETLRRALLPSKAAPGASARNWALLAVTTPPIFASSSTLRLWPGSMISVVEAPISRSVTFSGVSTSKWTVPAGWIVTLNVFPSFSGTTPISQLFGSE